jgi:protocatechuate 3,4-dioxygenase beta subunit
VTVDADLRALLDSTDVTCRDWAEQLEGPYRRGEQPPRSDIREDRAGALLALGLRVADERGRPLAGEVEVWHCDALGRYSGYPPPVDEAVPVSEATAPRGEYLADQTFLRGRQAADASGTVVFTTIYPGWYPGRAVHIHLMVHTADGTRTSQLYFPDEITDEVFELAPYRSRPARDTRNATDEIFPTGGDPTVLDVRRVDERHLAAARLHL